SRALGSSWPLRTPWRAQAGSAWCQLCQPSPNVSSATHHTFDERSRVRKGRAPEVWATEFTDHVTWWTTAERTRPPQKQALQAPAHDHDQSPPAAAGSTKDRATTAG